MTHKSIIERPITINPNQIPMRSQAREKPWEPGIASRSRGVLVGAFFLWVATGGTRADVVTDWNTAMTAYAAQVDAPSGALLPNVETRVYAMAHIAMLEAIKEAQSHRHHRNASASPEAAAAQAAHDVLAHEFADGASAFDALLASQLAAIADGPAKTKGVSIGMEEAAEILAARANDGSATATGHEAFCSPRKTSPQK